MKICLIASSGGHLEQILMLAPLIEKYSGFIVTEKTNYNPGIKCMTTYYLKQVNRSKWDTLFLMLINSVISIKILVTEKPDLIITTGALSVIPLCMLAKLFRKKLIFIESYAKISSPTLTGKLLYHFSDEFYVQWKEMLKHYPNAIYKGGIY